MLTYALAILYIKDLRKEGKRSFTIEEVINHFNISHNYAKVALHRLMKTGDLISPAKGFYVIVPPEHQPYGSIPPQELVPLVMQYLGANYYVALLSAGWFYGVTHQKPARFQVILDKRIKHPSTFGDVKIDYIYIYKKSMLELSTQDFTVPAGYLRLLLLN
jgi:predicted transcriptional regulator of viral defense system